MRWGREGSGWRCGEDGRGEAMDAGRSPPAGGIGGGGSEGDEGICIGGEVRGRKKERRRGVDGRCQLGFRLRWGWWGRRGAMATVGSGKIQWCFVHDPCALSTDQSERNTIL